MNKKLDKLIDINLKHIFESRDQSLLRFSLIDENGDRINDSESLARTLEQERLIEIKVNNCLLTKFGREVSMSGGWLMHLAKEQFNNKKLKENNELKEQKEIFDFKISKFQSEHKFLPYIISGLSLIISILAFFRGCELKHTPKTQEQIIEKPLIEHNDDSLRISKKQTDTLNIP